MNLALHQPEKIGAVMLLDPVFWWDIGTPSDGPSPRPAPAT
jgi:hypothetical protein